MTHRRPKVMVGLGVAIVVSTFAAGLATGWAPTTTPDIDWRLFLGALAVGEVLSLVGVWQLRGDRS